MAPRKKSANSNGKSQRVTSKRKANNAHRNLKGRHTPSPEPELPPWDEGIRSHNRRRRDGFKLSRASLHDESINEISIDKLYQGLAPESLSRMTWGMPLSAGIKAPKSRKTETLDLKLRKNFNGSHEQMYTQMMSEMTGSFREAVPNDPRKSPILRLSYEVRENVYKYLLVNSMPIMVKPDFCTVELGFTAYNATRRVCRLFYAECTKFIFQHNIIQAIFRKTSRSHALWTDPVRIPTQYISTFRNVVLDFHADCWSMDWYEKATESLQILINAKATISTLTMIVNPQRVGVSMTASGLESNPITFSDFVWYDGELMTCLRQLAPSQFKLIMKKGPTKRLTISMNLLHLGACDKQSIELLNEITMEILYDREISVHMELGALKTTFEGIFENDTWAVRVGKCCSNEPLPSFTHTITGGEAVSRHIEVSNDDPLAICSDIDGPGSEDDLMDEETED